MSSNVTKGSRKDQGKNQPKWTRFPVRSRPHCNVLADDMFDYPVNPDQASWKEMYPTAYKNGVNEVKILDIGCAWGGLLCALSSVVRDKLMLGIEIREPVVEYAQNKIKSIREEHSEDEVEKGCFKEGENIWIIRSNAMKNLPNFFQKEQLEKIFFCFPDPNVKKKNYRRRIITKQLVAMYAYILKEGGMIYTISDVEELGLWMQKHLEECPLFERVSDDVVEKDILIPYIKNSSEDAQRSTNKNLNKYLAVFRKVPVNMK